MFEFFFSGMCAFQSLFMLFMSFVCLMFGKLLAENFIYWRLIASRTKGRVVEIREKRGKDNQTYYYPVAEFIGKDGKLHRTTSDIGQNRFPEKEANRTVTVLYFPGKEEKARILGSGWLLFFYWHGFFRERALAVLHGSANVRVQCYDLWYGRGFTSLFRLAPQQSH